MVLTVKSFTTIGIGEIWYIQISIILITQLILTVLGIRIEGTQFTGI